MERVLGIGGYFLRAADPAALGVGDLDATLARLRAKGADVADDVQEMEGVGRFGWVTDPDGTWIELWQPA